MAVVGNLESEEFLETAVPCRGEVVHREVAVEPEALRHVGQVGLHALGLAAQVDPEHRRRLAPDSVVQLDWHNDMSRLILDINERIEAAADDRARGVIVRRLRRALEEER